MFITAMTRWMIQLQNIRNKSCRSRFSSLLLLPQSDSHGIWYNNMVYSITTNSLANDIRDLESSGSLLVSKMPSSLKTSSSHRWRRARRRLCLPIVCNLRRSVRLVRWLRWRRWLRWLRLLHGFCWICWLCWLCWLRSLQSTLLLHQKWKNERCAIKYERSDDSTRFLNRIYVDICVIIWIQLRYPKDTKFEKKTRKLTIDYSLVTFYEHL